MDVTGLKEKTRKKENLLVICSSPEASGKSAKWNQANNTLKSENVKDASTNLLKNIKKLKTTLILFMIGSYFPLIYTTTQSQRVCPWGGLLRTMSWLESPIHSMAKHIRIPSMRQALWEPGVQTSIIRDVSSQNIIGSLEPIPLIFFWIHKAALWYSYRVKFSHSFSKLIYRGEIHVK